MPFEIRATSTGGLAIGSDSVTEDDGLAVLGLLIDNPDWAHLIADVSGSDSPLVLPRTEELDVMHLLARTVRDLRLPRGFKIAIVRSPRTAARVADFVDLVRSVVVDLEVETFDTLDTALAWVDASLPTD
ncbi:MAG: hypothetical protein AAGC53_02055 [Actinomycetota bacterium]